MSHRIDRQYTDPDPWITADAEIEKVLGEPGRPVDEVGSISCDPGQDESLEHPLDQENIE